MDYTNLYNFLTENGIVVPSDAEVLQGIQTKFQEIFGTEIDLSPETPVGRLIEAMSVVVKSSLGVTAQSANQFNVNEATGIYLDSLGQVYNLTRIPGTKSRIVIKCYFQSGLIQPVTIAKGALITAGTKGEMFRTDDDISSEGALTEEQTGRLYQLGTATAIDAGQVIPITGTAGAIMTGTLGWIGVMVTAVSYIGTEVETDEAYRQRLIRSRATGRGFHSGLESKLNRLTGVYSSCILDNNTGEIKIIKGVNIPAHSIYVGLDFIETEELVKDIAQAISENKPTGTGMVKEPTGYGTLYTEEVEYGYGSDFKQEVTFYKANRVPINVSINYTLGKYIGLDVETDIYNAVAAYMDTVGVGGQVSAMMLATELSNRLHIGVGQILVQKSNSPNPFDIKVNLLGYEIPFSTEDYITLSES